jgi:hypothetical protein
VFLGGIRVTIAACYVSQEGVVFGADSTTTYGDPSGYHYYNHGQKLFEIGEKSTLGVVIWGLGGLPEYSHRTLLALLADDLKAHPPASVEDVAQRWADQFWAIYQASANWSLVVELRSLAARPAFQPGAAPAVVGARTEAEETRFLQLKFGLACGFCVGGYLEPDRRPTAFAVIVDPLTNAPSVSRVQGWAFYGAPNMIQRLLFGIDGGLKDAIASSPNWTGSSADLDALASQHALAHPLVPMREAVDFVHACISSTIKAMKFSNLSQICGGPIEIAVITSDRRFRWVRHKPWDSAITEGEVHDV